MEELIDQTLGGSQEGDQSPGGSQEGGSPPNQTIEVDGKTYPIDQAKELIKQGELTSQIEKEQNISIKELYPEFTRRSQRLKEFEEEGEENIYDEDYSSQEEEYENPYENPDENYSDETGLQNEIKQLRAEVKSLKENQSKSQQNQHMREIQREMSILKKKYGEIDKDAEKHVYNAALYDRNYNLEKAFKYNLWLKEQAEKEKEKTRGLGGTGASPRQGFRGYDPKKSQDENFAEAREDFERMKK